MTQSHPDPMPPSASWRSLKLSKIVATCIVLAAVASTGFFAGMQYQAKHQSPTPGQPNGQFAQSGAGGRGRFGARRGGGIQTVTAISSTSISVKSNRTGTTATYAITGSTKITDNQQTVAYSTIPVGTTVFVIPDTANANDAEQIIVNPGTTMQPAAPSSSNEPDSSEPVAPIDSQTD